MEAQPINRPARLPFDFGDADRKKLAAYQQADGTFLLCNGRRGANGMLWGPGIFASIAELQNWLDTQHEQGGWHETAVQTAPDVWEVMTDSTLARWEAGTNGANILKAALLAAQPSEPTEAARQPLPSLDKWKTYYFNGKQNSYDIEQDGVKYSITPIISQHGSGFIGYRLSFFDYANQQAGHQSIDPTHGVMALHAAVLFSRPSSAAKAARLTHANRATQPLTSPSR